MLAESGQLRDVVGSNSVDSEVLVWSWVGESIHRSIDPSISTPLCHVYAPGRGVELVAALPLVDSHRRRRHHLAAAATSIGVGAVGAVAPLLLATPPGGPQPAGEEGRAARSWHFVR